MGKFSFRALLAGCCLAAAVAFLSCTDEAYDLKGGLNMEMRVGGDSLYLPLGSTTDFTIKELLGNSELSSLLVLNDAGVYVLRPDLQEMGVDIESIDPSSLQIEDVVSDTIFPLGMAAKASAPVGATFGLDFLFADLPGSVIDLNRLVFDERTYFELSITFPSLPEGWDLSRITPALDITLPSVFIFPEGTGDVIHVDAFNTSSGYVQTLPLHEILVDAYPVENHSMHFVSEVAMTGAFQLDETLPLPSEGLEVEISCAVRSIYPEQVEGILNPRVDPLEIEAGFGDVPGALRTEGTSLDFIGPYLTLNLQSNIEFSLNANVDIVPVNGNVPDEGMRQVLELEIPASSLQGSNGNWYYIGDAEPADLPEGYDFVQADVAAMLRQLPDRIQVAVSAAPDTSRAYVYSFGETYQLDAAVEPEIPLVFGDNLFIAFSDTLSGLPSGLSSYMTDGELVIYGDIHNSYPLEFTMEIQALDADNRLLELQTSGPQLITSSQEGETSSSVEFRFADPDGILDQSSIAALAVHCEASTNQGLEGKAIKENSSFRAELKLRKTGGIVVDLNE